MKLKKIQNLQKLSLISRLTAESIGFLQSLFIGRILSIQALGAIELVKSITDVFGSSGSFGLTSSSTREISGAKNKKEAFQIFQTSLIMRLLLLSPFILLLNFKISDFLNQNNYTKDVAWALNIVPLIMILDATTGVTNSVISGLKKFNTIFIYQVVRAVLQVIIFVPLIYYLKFKGYYIAMLIFTLITSIILFKLAFNCFEKKDIKILKFTNFKSFAIELFKISIAIYIVKILQQYWFNSSKITLDQIGTYTQIAIFGITLNFSKRLLAVTDSLTDVNLPVFSDSIYKDFKQYKENFRKNYTNIYLYMTLFTTLIAFWGNEILSILSYIMNKQELLQGAIFMPLTVFSIWGISQIDLIKSSYFVPAKKFKQMILVYLLLFSTTLISYKIFSYTDLNIMILVALSLFIGTIFSYILCLYIIKDLKILNKNKIFTFLISILLIIIYYFLILKLKNVNFFIMFGIKIIITLAYLYIYKDIIIKIPVINKILNKVNS